MVFFSCLFQENHRHKVRLSYVKDKLGSIMFSLVRFGYARLVFEFDNIKEIIFFSKGSIQVTVVR